MEFPEYEEVDLEEPEKSAFLTWVERVRNGSAGVTALLATQEAFNAQVTSLSSIIQQAQSSDYVYVPGVEQPFVPGPNWYAALTAGDRSLRNSMLNYTFPPQQWW